MVVVLVVLGGCGAPGPSCDNLGELIARRFAGYTGNYVHLDEHEQHYALNTAHQCSADAWSGEVRTCLDTSTDKAAVEACIRMLPPEQQARLAGNVDADDLLGDGAFAELQQLEQDASAMCACDSDGCAHVRATYYPMTWPVADRRLQRDLETKSQIGRRALDARRRYDECRARWFGGLAEAPDTGKCLGYITAVEKLLRCSQASIADRAAVTATLVTIRNRLETEHGDTLVELVSMCERLLSAVPPEPPECNAERPDPAAR